MTDLATLGIEVRSRSAVEATQDLHKLAGAAGVAEAATDSLGRSAATASTSITMQNAAVKSSSAALQVHAASSRMAAFQQRNLVFQLNDVFVTLAMGMNPLMVAAQQGPQIAQIYGPDEGGLGRAFRETGRIITGVLGKFPLLTSAGIALAAAVGGLTYSLNEASGAGFSMGEVLTASIQVIAGSVYSVLQPAFSFISSAAKTAADVTTGFFKELGNNMIRFVLGSIEMIKGGVMMIPDAFIAAGGMAANGFLSAIEYMAREALVMVNGLLTDINGILPRDMQLPLGPSPTSVRFERFDTGGAVGRLGDRARQTDANLTNIASRDFLGEFGAAVGARALANRLKEVEDGANNAGGALKRAATDAKDPWDGIRKVVEMSKEAATEFGSSIGGVFKGLVDGTMNWKDAATQAFQSVLKYVNQLNVAGGGAGIFGGGFFQSLLGGFIGVPGFANGTNSAPGGLAMVGERGPELVNLPRGSQVIPSAQTRDMMGSNINMPITINAPGANEAKLEQVRREVVALGRSLPSQVDARMNTNQVRGTRPQR